VTGAGAESGVRGRHRAWCDFAVTRRIDWKRGSLRAHVDAVVDAVGRRPEPEEIVLDADLVRARVSLILVLVLGAADDAELAVRRLLAEAIARCGGLPVGVLPEAEEARVRPVHDGPWSGLRLPRWTLVGIRLEEPA
jgi:hypothetical protein